MRQVLVVDDERDLAELVAYNLKKEGFAVDVAYDGETALTAIKNGGYDLIVLDLMLPGMQGLDLCAAIRNTPSTARTPLIMLTAKGEEIDKVVGLEMGADDYITKPFSPREFMARVKAVLRRTEQRPAGLTGPPPAPVTGGAVLKTRDIVIDKEKYTVTVAGRQIKLSATEFKLLLYLCERPNKIYSREHLLDAVWGDDVFVEPRTVDVHIRRLRTKIEDDANNPRYIKTMRGVGYFFEA